MRTATTFKLACAVAVLASPLATAATTQPPALPATPPAAEVAVIKASGFPYRVAGDFSRAGQPATAPLRQTRLDTALRIMVRQVTAAEYARCVDDGGCQRIAGSAAAEDRPMVGVSWRDATAYARWMTAKTGRLHRLPTDEEWVFAAAEKATDDVLPVTATADPVRAWIARYEAEAGRERPVVLEPQPIGAFGRNRNGLQDAAGNVWEWTDTCFIRHDVDASGATRVTNTNCGVRVVQGAHRAYMTDFIRDPSTGGCAAGVPPANLGFRLVVEQERWPGLRRIIERVADRMLSRWL